MDKEFNINKKYCILKLIILVVFLAMVISVDISFIISGLSSTSMLLMTILPFVILLIGGISVIFVIIKDILKLKYKSKLIENNNYIIYDDYFTKKIKIKKDNITKVYSIKHSNDFFFNERYISIVTKRPIREIKNNKKSFLQNFDGFISSNNCLYINCSELTIDQEKFINELNKK